MNSHELTALAQDTGVLASPDPHEAERQALIKATGRTEDLNTILFASIVGAFLFIAILGGLACN